MKRDQLVTPLMTDEEAQSIARRSVMAVEALGFVTLLMVCVFAWVALPA